MKKLLVVSLLSIIVLLFVSCNTYDVEGKPEVAANPAKKVFAYYPWGAGEDITDPEEEENDKDAEEQDEEVTDDDSVPDEDPVPDEEPDETEQPDEEMIDNDQENPDATTIIPFSDGSIPPELGELTSSSDQQEFEVINRGVTGELKIRKINILDPDMKLISEDNGHPVAYRNLFKIQVSKTENGITQSGFNEETLSFDNTVAEEGADIAPLCPLDIDDPTKCKGSFKENKFNTRFRLLLSYDESAAKSLGENPPADLKTSGDFWIEICTNDPTKEKSVTCGNNATSYLIQVTRQPNPPPKPLIKVDFDYPVGGVASYRNIKDKVSLNLRRTCVSDPDNPSQCLANWDARYYIKYKWEMKESPTPYLPESQLRLPDTQGLPGQWLPDLGKDNPRRAEFTGLMVTPRRFNEENPDYNESRCTECGTEPTDDEDEFFANKLSEYLLCRQRYCEKNKTRFYKVNIQAETVDKETDLISETAELTVIPKIIPQARVVAQLTWDKGYRTETEADSDMPGTKIDLDLHLIKKASIEAAGERDWPIKDGLMCGLGQSPGMGETINCFDPQNEIYCRHDDCYFADQGAEAGDLEETIAWNATYDYDNKHGGGNFESPEVIGLGPIEKDGALHIDDDEYLVVVGYSYCTTRMYEDSSYDTCCDPEEPGCTGKGEGYGVTARVDIMVDGVDAPRKAREISGSEVRPSDNYSITSKEFVINPGEWKIVSIVKWDNELPPPDTNPNYTGDGIVSDIEMTEHGIEIDASSYKRCNWDVSHCRLVPVWDEQAYYDFVSSPQTEGDETGPTIGTCY